MKNESPYFDQATFVLSRAIKASGLAERERLMDEALRLNRLALAEERLDLERVIKEVKSKSLPRPGRWRRLRTA